MELPKEVMEQLTSAEKDIKFVQDWIDEHRSLYPNDQEIQLIMDRTQRALDVRKQRVRQTKSLISKLTA